MKQMFLTGIALTLFAVGMTASGPAHAYPEPKARCTSADEGASATTTSNDGYFTYYYTYMCNSSQWVLVDVLQCSNANGYCANW